MFSVKNKVVVVTGGNGLLGKAICNALKEQEAVVIGTDIRFEKQGEHDYFLDITDENAVITTVKEIAEKYGKIDGWINNAYPRTSDWGNKLEDVPFESWRKNVDMHLNGYFLCSKVVLEYMKKYTSGSLINMASIYGVVGPDFNIYAETQMTMPVAYAAIKGGLINLTRYLAAYYGPYNVRVNAISPGGIFDNQPEQFVKRYTEKVPLRRMGTPADITSAIQYLIADEASYITGHNLIIDGGWTAI
ncbi:NAD(P)-dependent dehydrogenase, short-chain alcohol dehydrogenase family [Chitinophaga rupis]|uniref:NAD(P)-dependent dehydrogenase, short-chain alcohol dehydrogenase family n=1 Tax=Chitinophaga rupis TaxID=573321 RepID=A0A1H7LNR5_9BACT|nr:SDR family oxidoreductase [Chitinophaga rupis]SEL00489.1 NAD(P)-dependent dehydrogenase, short-chain alcohol dehydrogenase family [Chitinophaga rupis]